MEHQLTIDIEQSLNGELFRFANTQKKKNLDKNLNNLFPISYSINALPHSPVYRMHRYFARRPYNVFYELIKYYTNEGGIILDPFCGGGVTVIESLRLRRKVIGIDINPMATFITRCEAMDLNIEDLTSLYHQIENNVSEEISKLYYTACPRCKKYAVSIWARWAGISRATFFRWLKEGTIADVKHKDRKGWRLFTDEDIENLKKEANKVISVETDNRQLKLKLSEARKLY